MKSRCTNPKAQNYRYYGAMGISVCAEWMEFVPFMEWALQNGYNDSLTIDRIESDFGYMPENCRWATQAQQQANRVYKKSDRPVSRYRGVEASGNRWRARIKHEGRVVNLGCFGSEQEAAAAYDRAAIERHGEFAVLNFVDTPAIGG